MVDWAMRYGNPSIASRLDALQHAGCDRILIVPLYPQYCAGHDRDRRRQGVRCAEDDALAAGGAHRAAVARRSGLHRGGGGVARSRARASSPFKPEMILASFHGVPKDYLLKGDPYHCQCQKTARLLRRAARPRREPLHAHLPVALRHRRMAAALHRHDREGAGRARREEPRDRHARLHGRLPGNAGGNRGRECRDFSPSRRRELRRDSLPERQRSRNDGDRARCAARAEGLDRPEPAASPNSTNMGSGSGSASATCRRQVRTSTS